MRFLRNARALTRPVQALALGLLLVAAPEAAKANPKYAGIVVDAKTGKTLYSSSADAYRYPASLTKIMTLYVVFEELEAGRLSLDSRLKVSKYASGRPPSKIGLKPGKTIRVKDAILALVTKSANDVATVVAENIGGSEKKFAERMTRTARQLGMKKTTFRNPHGLPNSGQRTSARDMATLGRAIQERFPQYYGYFKTRSYKYNGRTYGNHNRLLGRVKGVDGIKTGYIRASGFNLVTSVKRDGRHIVAVVMGGRSGKSRNAQMTKLINRYLPKASRGKKTAPAIVKRGIQPVFVASAMKNPPLPATKPGSKPALAKAGPIVLASASAPAPSPVAPTTASSKSVSTISFGNTVPVPPKLVKRRFDNTFAIATALPPVPPASPKGNLTTNSITKIALLKYARAEAARRGLIKDDSNLELSNPVFKTVEVETIRIDPVPQDAIKAKVVDIEDVKVAAVDPVQPPVDVTETSDDSVTVATSDSRAIEPGWQVQIAAAETEGQAIKMLKSAKAKTGAALRGRSPYTEPVESGGKTLYRARFVGFETKSAAKKACRTLKKARYACFAIYQ
ncbi:MAG: D-alanyl-D-alanine carboxypeptidase [Roseibium sp.]|uniref:D-alanyl-D-alanine carboxypeptidase n=1 Tax=Roseibium sp. TaxID=1936156 RepID=UPI001B131F88|nr:D-alanyl-D-alanine carboxypeptidase [Roseibium sp.]MBO6930935.1 D-alanyl-D-alanine carboxypeptidase [Roseibium sp.]